MQLAFITCARTWELWACVFSNCLHDPAASFPNGQPLRVADQRPDARPFGTDIQTRPGLKLLGRGAISGAWAYGSAVSGHLARPGRLLRACLSSKDLPAGTLRLLTFSQ